MSYFMVFGSVKRPLIGGGSYLDWTQNGPIGVYEGADADEACKAAAADTQGMGTFFAVPGEPWGLELMAPDAGRFGSHASPIDRLSHSLDKLEEIDEKIARLTRGQGDN